MPDPTFIAGTKVLAKYAASGVGSIAGPILASWRASREGKAALISAEYRSKVRIIEAKAEAEALAIMSDAQKQVIQSVEQGVESAKGGIDITGAGINQAIEFQTLKRTANFSSVIEDAASELEDVEVPDHEPDADWTARFFGYEQDVSSEDLRKIWARILSGEIRNPGQTSLRTLEILRNLSSYDAAMFAGICPFVLRNGWIFYEDLTHVFQELNYNKLLHLQDCGLLDIGFSLQIEMNFDALGQIFIYQQKFDLLIGRDQGNSKTLTVPVIRLTSAGLELYKVAKNSLDIEYLHRFATFLRTKNCSFYRLEDPVKSVDGKSTHYLTGTPIEPHDDVDSEKGLADS